MNVHSSDVKNSTESHTEPPATAVSSPPQSESLPTAAAAAAVCSFDGEYLQRLHEQLRRLCEHADSRVQDAALRLMQLSK